MSLPVYSDEPTGVLLTTDPVETPVPLVFTPPDAPRGDIANIIELIPYVPPYVPPLIEYPIEPSIPSNITEDIPSLPDLDLIEPNYEVKEKAEEIAQGYREIAKEISTDLPSESQAIAQLKANQAAQAMSNYADLLTKPFTTEGELNAAKYEAEKATAEAEKATAKYSNEQEVNKVVATIDKTAQKVDNILIGIGRELGLVSSDTPTKKEMSTIYIASAVAGIIILALIFKK
jgi:hypothetical protein